MKNKRIIALIALLAAFCLILGACSSSDIKKQNAYQLVKGAVEKTSKLDSYKIEMQVTTTSDFLGEKLETPISFIMDVEGATGNALKAIGTMSMSALGIEIQAGMYMENGIMYLNVENQKIKLDASSESAKSYQFADIEENLIKTIPEDVLKNVQVQDNSDGSRTVAVNIDSQKFSEIYNELIREYTNEEAYAQLVEDLKTEITVKDAAVSITVLSSGYIGNYDIKFDMDVKMSSKTASIEMTTPISIDAKVRFVEPGTKVTVTAPSDLNEYVDISEMTDIDL